MLCFWDIVFELIKLLTIRGKNLLAPTLLWHSMATKRCWPLHRQFSEAPKQALLLSVGLVCSVWTASACCKGEGSDPLLTQAFDGASLYRQSSTRHTLSTPCQTGKTKCWNASLIMHSVSRSFHIHLVYKKPNTKQQSDGGGRTEASGEKPTC